MQSCTIMPLLLLLGQNIPFKKKRNNMITRKKGHFDPKATKGTFLDQNINRRGIFGSNY